MQLSKRLHLIRNARFTSAVCLKILGVSRSGYYDWLSRKPSNRSRQKGFVYLSCIMDLFSRKIVSWELAPTLETKYVINAIRKAIARTGARPAVIHSDRGVQYASVAYWCETKGIQRSYSSKADPWDNACIESFHVLIKREWLNRFVIRDKNHAHSLVFEYIDAFYNTRRIHSSCGYVAPIAYENQYYMQQILLNAAA